METRANRVRKILFVCTANVCRSPMAKEIFNAVAEDRRLARRAASAGVAALENEAMVPNARAALEEIGIYTEGHRARQVSKAMLQESDLVLTMNPRHAAELRRRFGSLPEKVYTLQEYTTNAPAKRESRIPTGTPCPPTAPPYASSSSISVSS